MTKKLVNINRIQKILLILHDLSMGKKKDIRYEDIVVALFKKYPLEFHLRGYPEYPDSGDGPQRLLYEEKKKGNITAGNKLFKLTNKGVSYAENLKKELKGKKIGEKARLSRFSEKEVKRILSSNAFNLFIANKTTEIFDTDFYNYLNSNVRTDRSDFRGKIKTMKDLVKELEGLTNDSHSKTYKAIIDFHNFLFKKFKAEIDFKLK